MKFTYYAIKNPEDGWYYHNTMSADHWRKYPKLWRRRRDAEVAKQHPLVGNAAIIVKLSIEEV